MNSVSIGTEIEEVWKPVVGYEGKYEVSNFGRVKSLNVGGHGGVKIMKVRVTYRGYAYVDLAQNGKYKKENVHRLVCSAFKRPPVGNEQVNHIDGNKLNNVPENLEWCTPSENIRHAFRTGLKVVDIEAMRKINLLGEEKRKEYRDRIKRPVIAESLTTGETTWFESVNAAARGTSSDLAAVAKVLKKVYRQTNGYVFTYASDESLQEDKKNESKREMKQ